MKVLSTENQLSCIGLNATCQKCGSEVEFDSAGDAHPTYYEGHGIIFWWWTCPYCGAQSSMPEGRNWHIEGRGTKMLKRLFWGRLTEKERKIIGSYSNDGALYSGQQWKAARELLEATLHNVASISALIIVGSLTAWDGDGRVIGAYYMRDLVRGIVRDNEQSRMEYQEAVRRAGLC